MLTPADCQWLGNRLGRMDAARPRQAREPHQLHCGEAADAIETEQLAAFEAGVENWWRVIPAPAGADPGVWHFLEEEEGAW